MYRHFSLLPLLLLIVASTPSFAGLFDSEELLKVTIEGDLSKSWSERDRKLRKYHPAVLTINSDEEVQLQMKVRGHRRGGNYENEQGQEVPVCDFPPLKIKALTENEYFPKGKSFKLVSHCNDLENTVSKDTFIRGLRGGENYLLREYIAYKVQNIITPISYRVRLLQIRYVDSSGVVPEVVRYGIILEKSKSLAKRNGLKYLGDQEEIDLSKINPEHGIKLSYFQKLIGNTDYDLSKKTFHNVKLFKDKNNKIIPLAYDFNQTEIADLSRFEIPGRFSSHRRLSCAGSSESLFRKEAMRILTLKNEVFNRVKEDEFLSWEDKAFILYYINSRFNEISTIDEAIFESTHHVEPIFSETNRREVLDQRVNPDLCDFNFSAKTNRI